MARRSSENLIIDSAFCVLKCDELPDIFQKLLSAKVEIYGGTPFTEGRFSFADRPRGRGPIQKDKDACVSLRLQL